MLNISITKRPRFSKNFMQDAPSIEAAISGYHQAVKQALFPSIEHSF
jgi:3-methyl-2-oxobutanoate hydroxymethyltransferase